ncbi:MAG: 5-formyltetrahydrofolate cyclo-ligase [Desulfovibrio sp.]|nr:5-formyltetrahydrofolate cyclo-ligase [Desulfovibrio sp.]
MLPDASVNDKSSLRSFFRARRKALSVDETRRRSALIRGHILQAPSWEQAGVVALYMAVGGEVDLGPLLDAAFGQKKTVLLPRCSRSHPGHMRLDVCADRDCLCPGPYGILEPDHGTLRAAAPVPDLVLTPGVAFDARGVRLGAGGGYYDRLFAQPAYASCLRLGIAYDFQIVPALPSDVWDTAMHGLCTEHGLTWINQKRPPL